MSNPPFGRFPLNNTTPFTFRDSYTFLELLNEFLETVDTVEKNEIAFKKAVNAALAEGKKAADDFMADMTTKYRTVLSQLIGYTIEVGTDTYRASMMDGSVFEAYTLAGVDNRLETLRSDVDNNIETLSFTVNKKIDDKTHGWVNVKEYGAVGDGVTLEYEAFRDAFAGGNKTVYVPEGEYRINQHIQLEANTVVEMHPNAVLINESDIEYVFLNGVYNNSSFSTGYNGPGNITIRGGVFDGRVKVGRYRNSCFIGISHAANVLIENVTFQNGYASHLLEINSSRDVTVRNCAFKNLNNANLQNREFINIDYSFGSGYPAHGAYDGTPCLNVTVENCSFTNGSDGVGTHSNPGGNKHSNIKVLNNRFNNLSAHAITPRYWRDSLISGNTVDGSLTAVRISPGGETITVSGNVFANVGNFENSAIYVNNANGCMFTNNTITPRPADVYTEAIVVSGTSRNTYISTHGITDGTRDGKIRIYNSALPSTINNVTTVHLENGTKQSVPFNATSKQGIVTIACRSGAQNSPRGIYWVRCSNSVEMFIEKISSVQYQDNVVLDKGIPTVEGVEAGKFAVYAGSDGYIHLVNKTGDARTIDLSIVGN